MSTHQLVNPLTGEPVSNVNLLRIAELAKRQVRIERAIEAAEAGLAELQEHLTKVRDQELPDAMNEVGMASFSLSDGTGITVLPFYAAKIPSDKDCEEDPGLIARRVAAFKWLRENGHDALIKRNLILALDRGQDKIADEIKALIVKKFKLLPQDKELVHPQTLKAFVREQVEGGNNLPMETFGVHIGKRSKVTPAN